MTPTHARSESSATCGSAAPAHSRNSSGTSVYSLASPLMLSPATAPVSHKGSRTSIFSKLKHKRSKHEDDDGFDWKCKGEDLEDNFVWPPPGWSETAKDIQAQLDARLRTDTSTPPLAHSRSDSGSSTFSTSSSGPSTRHSSGAYSNFSAASSSSYDDKLLPALPIRSTNQRKHSRSRAPHLFIPLPVYPLRLNFSLSPDLPSSPFSFAPQTPDEKREAAENAAVDAINDYFANIHLVNDEGRHQVRSASDVERPSSARPLPRRPNSCSKESHSRPMSFAGEQLSTELLAKLQARSASQYAFI